MTLVYKPLVDGGFTSRRAESPVVLQRLLRDGWTETCPVVAPINVPKEPADPLSVRVVELSADAPDEAPKRRGRKPKGSVV